MSQHYYKEGKDERGRRKAFSLGKQGEPGQGSRNSSGPQVQTSCLYRGQGGLSFHLLFPYFQ